MSRVQKEMDLRRAFVACHHLALTSQGLVIPFTPVERLFITYCRLENNWRLLVLALYTKSNVNPPNDKKKQPALAAEMHYPTV